MQCLCILFAFPDVDSVSETHGLGDNDGATVDSEEVSHLGDSIARPVLSCEQTGK